MIDGGEANDASPLISVSIAGAINTMANMASRTFSRNSATAGTFNISDAKFLQSFATFFHSRATRAGAPSA
jgi:hypothetical protein